jgi:hypothetical protein
MRVQQFDDHAAGKLAGFHVHGGDYCIEGRPYRRIFQRRFGIFQRQLRLLHLRLGRAHCRLRRSCLQRLQRRFCLRQGGLGRGNLRLAGAAAQ